LIHPTSSVIQEKSDDVNWWAEIKKNGSRLCLWKSKEDSKKHNNFNNFIFWNRTKELLSYTPSQELIDELNSLDIPDGTHIDAELLHQKTKHIKHFIYVYDIYRFKGKEVFETLEVRRRMIEDIVGDKLKHIQLAQIYQDDFPALFKKVILEEENEGIVMKNKKGKIVWNLKSCVEVGWQLKVRKSSKSYSF
jgi:ATP-dependent DNA ligase